MTQFVASTYWATRNLGGVDPSDKPRNFMFASMNASKCFLSVVARPG
jgi:hypothetical protein